MKIHASANRLEYLDWVRGLGALIMLNGHVWHSYLKPELKTSGIYQFTQFVGGMPPALFLFLTGVTLAFLMDSTERRGLSTGARVFEALKRSRYLFLLAFAFRLQLWIFGLPAAWEGLFKVDVLNCMGFSIAIFAVMAAFRRVERIRLCAVLGLAIAFLSPVISQMNWSGVPWMVRAYLVPDYNFFGLFPWGAYLAFGISLGSIIRTVPQELMDRMMQWGALAGGVLILASQYFANSSIAIYTKSDYWMDSPAQVLTKLGVLLLMVSCAFVWTRYGARPGWSWIRQLGTTSLLVYWVHIELVYGKASWFFKDSLTIPQTVLATAIVIPLMLLVSTMQSHRERWKEALTQLGWSFAPKSDAAAGD
ncbi:MAG TPA: acyltransferase family protein [Candidatus Acidoferrum sp.]|nr:acyltransferase family protein [Candidatus Acidoferrum sp.]